jgi:AcrR family transcriptional regulator
MSRTYDETSEALLAAAHQILATSGPEALTVRRIATEAGMSTMNVYSRFGGKDGVIDELYAEGYRRLIAEIQAEPVGDDIPATLLAVAYRYRKFALDQPAYYGIMFRHTVTGFDPSDESIEQAIANLGAFVSLVQIGQERGDIVATPESDATEIAAWLWATCHGLISFELDGVASEFINWESIFDHGLKTAIGGLHPAAHNATRN